ncbi:uncharacterized protein LOC131498045 [Neofelis nebulosa]|uniref:uncharacterized protein LOC131498045 n=1 Tax=Neofelis nebulosa TaxID=61452 RepID=UPI00272D02BE|nr:uncharacterized protein LOC131498045 [Neofelis nebulosa]
MSVCRPVPPLRWTELVGVPDACSTAWHNPGRCAWTSLRAPTRRGPQARFSSPGVRARLGGGSPAAVLQSRSRRALCRPLPEAPAPPSSPSCHLRLPPPAPPLRPCPRRQFCVPAQPAPRVEEEKKSGRTIKSRGKAARDAETTTLPRTVKDPCTCVQPRDRGIQKRARLEQGEQETSQCSRGSTQKFTASPVSFSGVKPNKTRKPTPPSLWPFAAPAEKKMCGVEWRRCLKDFRAGAKSSWRHRSPRSPNQSFRPLPSNTCSLALSLSLSLSPRLLQKVPQTPRPSLRPSTLPRPLPPSSPPSKLC